MNCTVSARRLIPGIIAIALACTFILISFSIAAVPSHGNSTLANPSSADKSVVDSNSSIMENSNSIGIGYVRYTLILNNNSLVNGYIYFVGRSSNSLIAVNGTTNRIVDTISVGQEPQNAAFDPINGFVYVTNQLSNSVTVINGTADRIVANVAVGSGPIGVTSDPASGTMYVMNSFSNNITVISETSNHVIKGIPAGQYPEAAIFDPGNGYVYVANADSVNITVINGTSNNVINSFNFQISAPNGMALCPLNGYLYAASGSDQVYAINLTADSFSPSSITVGSGPQEVAFDSSNGYLYVSNFNSGTASIISTGTQTFESYSVTFTETGLEAGSTWYVNFNGINKSSTAGNISYSAINGTYPFTVGSAAGYGLSPASGKITDKGSDVIQVISFSPSGGSQLFGLSSTEIYVAGAVVAITIIGGSVFLLNRKRKQI